ncbi:MAG TPA: thiopeptide-type bacteriocin biosynthesis protein [Candidatus Polarisedimenticolia bacterium]|nr:thiopeptide-type bacteriocin biosynthesis protein [Candidatus Polarisedimenticolia bacterium]
MTSQRCLYTLLYSPRESHEEILRELVGPVTREARMHADLDSLFYARFNVPRWQVRFRVLGRPDWVEGQVRELVEDRLSVLQERGLIEGYEFAEYQREYDRYGGEEGMALAEQIFLHDTLACLDLIEADRQGRLEKSRREFVLVITERFLDLLEMDRSQRLVFYEHGYRWAMEGGSWRDEEHRILQERYQSLVPGMNELFGAETARNPAAQYGGPEAARIARDFLESVRPVAKRLLEAHRKGRISQDLTYLAWSYTHMQCNRLGIDPAPEAILRFFMHRFLEDHPESEA